VPSSPYRPVAGTWPTASTRGDYRSERVTVASALSWMLGRRLGSRHGRTDPRESARWTPVDAHRRRSTLRRRSHSHRDLFRAALAAMPLRRCLGRVRDAAWGLQRDVDGYDSDRPRICGGAGGNRLADLSSIASALVRERRATVLLRHRHWARLVVGHQGAAPDPAAMLSASDREPDACGPGGPTRRARCMARTRPRD